MSRFSELILGVLVVAWVTGDGNAHVRTPTLCGSVAARISALPRSTAVEDWPDLISIPGVTHPHWNREDALKNIIVVKVFYAYASVPVPGLPGVTGDPTIWDKVKGRVLREIAQGVVRLESTTIDLTKPGTRTKLYRLSDRNLSMGTIGGLVGNGEKQTTWKYLIASTEQRPDLRNLPLFFQYPNMQVMLTRRGTYFAVAPDQIRQFSFVPEAPNPADDLICDFHLWLRRVHGK